LSYRQSRRVLGALGGLNLVVSFVKNAALILLCPLR